MRYEIIQLCPDTWQIENEFVRFFLLAGTKKALLIDSGATTPDANAIARSLTDLPLCLLNTHGDGDHTSGNGSFDTFYMAKEDYDGCGLAGKFPNSHLLPVQDGDVIDLGDRPLEIVRIPGHTKGSVAILDITRRALYAGDSVQNGVIFMFGGHRAPGSFAESLKKLEALSFRFDTVFASHGKAQLPPSHIAAVLQAWNAVQSGAVAPVAENVHGNSVLRYQTADCGFYC